jgi:hypothetical protein
VPHDHAGGRGTGFELGRAPGTSRSSEGNVSRVEAEAFELSDGRSPERSSPQTVPTPTDSPSRGPRPSAPSTNTSHNTRIAFRRVADSVANDEQSCATWSSQTASLDQEGAALRVTESGSGFRKSITVTKNIWLGGYWIFNVHVWDTSTPQVVTQIASFDLGSVFDANRQLAPLPWSLCARVVGATVSFIAWPSVGAAVPGPLESSCGRTTGPAVPRRGRTCPVAVRSGPPLHAPSASGPSRRGRAPARSGRDPARAGCCSSSGA